MNRKEVRGGGSRRGNDTDMRRKEKENRKLQLELRSEKEKLNSSIIKYQREINEMQAVSRTVTQFHPMYNHSSLIMSILGSCTKEKTSSRQVTTLSLGWTGTCSSICSPPLLSLTGPCFWVVFYLQQLSEESQMRIELQMALDSKDSDIEQLRNLLQSLSVQSMDSASVSSGPEFDADDAYTGKSSTFLKDVYVTLTQLHFHFHTFKQQQSIVGHSKNSAYFDEDLAFEGNCNINTSNCESFFKYLWLK